MAFPPPELRASLEAMTVKIEEEALFKSLTAARNLLCISSHVVHGSVGNDAIQFPLNLRNWNVDTISTTNLSAHPGHGTFTGGKCDAGLIKRLFSGLQSLSLDSSYEVVVIGYIASDSILETVWHDVLKPLKKNDILIAVMDPVMGDNGKAYVDTKIVSLYKSLLATNEIEIDLLTPNQFEMEILADSKITSWDTLLNALAAFCTKYTNVQNVVITSVVIDGDMFCVGAGNGRIFYYQVNEVDAVFSGSGDLFLGILTDEFAKSDKNLVQSLGKTLQTVENVLELSYQLSARNNGPRKKMNNKLYIPDLKLVESRPVLLSKVCAKDAVYLK